MTTVPVMNVDLPQTFAGIAIEDSAEATERSIRATAAQLSVHSGQNEARVVTGLGTLAAVLAPNQVRLFGRFAVGTTADPVLATLAIAMLPGAGGQTADTLAKRCQDNTPHAVVHVVDLPVGPAVLVTSAVDYPALERPALTAEFRIPLPGNGVVLLTVVTDDEIGWPAVAAEAMRLATSVRLHPDERRR